MTDEQKQEKKQAINQRMGQRITSLRKLAGLSQDQLADKAGIGRTHLSRIEQGKYDVTFWIVQAIAEALGMTVDIIDERLADLTPMKTLTSTADVR